jgi:uncharacterized protein (TIGR02147 family)
MSIFNDLSYRDILKFRVNSLKKTQSSISFQSMAKAIRVQAPYISKVIRGHADFNDDQLYLACKFLSFSEEEIEYLFLLLDFERSALSERKNQLLKKIQTIQKRNLDTTSHIDSNNLNTKTSDTINYYLDPIHLIVHMYLLIEEYDQDLKVISNKLNLSIKRVEQIIESLLKMGIIKFEKGKYVKRVKHLHLPKSSTICLPHQQLLRQMCIHHFQNQADNKKNYNLAITFTGDEKAKQKIQERFLEFLKDSDKIMDDAPVKDVFQMNFDLFSWATE